MTNRIAPYNDPEAMKKIIDWWEHEYPENRAKAPEHGQWLHIIDLYKSYETYTGQEVYQQGWIDANQFAKCLVAARIADCGGFWAMLPTWKPKEYEIRRAKVY